MPSDIISGCTAIAAFRRVRFGFGLRVGNLFPLGVKGELAGGSDREIIRLASFCEPALELVAGNGGKGGGSCQCPVRFDEHCYHSLCFRHFVAVIKGDASGDIARKSRNNAFTCARVADVIQAGTTIENLPANWSYTAGNRDTGECGAIFKSAVTNESYTAGNRDTGEVGAIIKSVGTNGSYIIWKCDAA